MIALICLVAAFIVAVLWLLHIGLGTLDMLALWAALFTAYHLFGPVGPPAPFWRRDTGA